MIKKLSADWLIQTGRTQIKVLIGRDKQCILVSKQEQWQNALTEPGKHCLRYTVADPGGEGPWPPGPVKISHKKDGCQRQPHRFYVSCPPLPGRWIRY